MDSAVPSTGPSVAEIENLGVLFIGFIATTILYGLTFFQTYVYYSRYPKDFQWMKYLVGTLYSLDTVVSALISEVLYYYVITLFDVNTEVLYATNTFCTQYMISVALTFISRLFFVYRVFQVTAGSRMVVLILAFLSSIALVFGLTSSAQMFAQRRLSAFSSPKMEIVAVISQVAGMAADMIVFSMMCYSFRRARSPESLNHSQILSSFVRMLVGRGLVLSLTQMAYLCTFVAAPSKQFWVPLQMVACKLYVNTLLGHLNSRDIVHGRGLNEEEHSARRARVSKRPHTSIRLTVPDSDAKATTVRSVHFNTRCDDNESEHTELDSRKTCQDQEGNEYSQVSTGSSQSQTDNDADKRSLSEGLS